jgi:EAL domain-containing protein (putative c-di-GMP-specific phosphodiesterase class I)
MISRHGVAPQRLRVEITESAVLEDPDLMLRTLNDLRETGVLAVLDDFGTGYSSLSYLHRFPLRCIKIDRSFVEAMRLGQEGGSEADIRAVLAMSSALDMDVIAEGIETRRQQDALLALGCPYGQGFLFSPPRPASGVGPGRVTGAGRSVPEVDATCHAGQVLARMRDCPCRQPAFVPGAVRHPGPKVPIQPTLSIPHVGVVPS